MSAGSDESYFFLIDVFFELGGRRQSTHRQDQPSFPQRCRNSSNPLVSEPAEELQAFQRWEFLLYPVALIQGAFRSLSSLPDSLHTVHRGRSVLPVPYIAP